MSQIKYSVCLDIVLKHQQHALICVHVLTFICTNIQKPKLRTCEIVDNVCVVYYFLYFQYLITDTRNFDMNQELSLPISTTHQFVNN